MIVDKWYFTSNKRLHRTANRRCRADNHGPWQNFLKSKIGVAAGETSVKVQISKKYPIKSFRINEFE